MCVPVIASFFTNEEVALASDLICLSSPQRLSSPSESEWYHLLLDPQAQRLPMNGIQSDPVPPPGPFSTCGTRENIDYEWK